MPLQTVKSQTCHCRMCHVWTQIRFLRMWSLVSGYNVCITLLHVEWPKLYRVLAILSAVELNKRTSKKKITIITIMIIELNKNEARQTNSVLKWTCPNCKIEKSTRLYWFDTVLSWIYLEILILFLQDALARQHR